MTELTDSDPRGMTSTVKAFVALLAVALLIALGFLFRSTGRAADLEASVAALESERAGLQEKLAEARKDATDLQAKLSDVQSKLNPLESKQAAAMRINQEFVVAPGGTQTYAFMPTVVPGTLSGSWRSSGQGYGGSNDTISAFRLTDPKDVQLEASPAGPVSNGRFFVVTEHGAYTFFFDNKGILRNTPRRVFLDAEFKPD